MAQLAIRGHATRGKEVIEILEMLGAINSHNLYGDENYAYYTIDGDKEIKGVIYVFGDEQLCYFTLEEFLEKYPYKVGDKVNYVKYNDEYPDVYTIQRMQWTGATIEYLLGFSGFSALTKDLQPYKEKTMTEITIDIPKGYEFAGVDDDNHQVVFTKIGYHYPKTYEECCKVLGYSGNYNMILTTDVDNKLFDALYRLKVCRDAYWKIAGDWNPDFANHDEKFIIACYYGKIYTTIATNYNRVLVFPTKEIRDAFYENFKDLIEQCKELL